MKEKIESYIIGILLPLAIGSLSALLTRGSVDVYQTIIKPDLAPPAIVFPIVWPILYILMGVGSTIIFNSQGVDPKEKKNALQIYAIQLALNFLWSIIFFNFRAFGLSFVVIIVLWILILLMILKFAGVNKVAGLLQIPYLLWVTFATYLNFMIYILNR